VTTAYAPGDWGDFGTAAATAAAALAGLLFIAVSINLKAILAGKSLPARAALTLVLFATPLIASLLLIVPGQSRVALAAELLATGVTIGGWQVYLDVTTDKSEEDTLYRRLLGRVFPSVTSCGCLILAGATLLAQAGGGLYWLVPGFICAIGFGLINVWVLLVEIVR